MKIRHRCKQTASPSVMVLGTKSIKLGNRQSNNGFDANRKVKGIKFNIAIDRNGFIRYVSSAGIHYSRLASQKCEQVPDAWSSVRKWLIYSKYCGELIENIERDFNIDIEFCSIPNGISGFTPKIALVGGGMHFLLVGRIL